MDIPHYMQTLGRNARSASRAMAAASTAAKNLALNRIADRLRRSETELIAANALDLAAAREAGLEAAMVDR